MNLFTTGPARLGYVLISGNGIGGVSYYDASQGDMQLTFGLNPFNNAPTVYEGCGEPNMTGFGCYNYSGLLPLQLGVPLSLAASVSEYADDMGPTAGYGVAIESFTFQLFENDGRTPVDIAFVTPEPRTWSLAALGLAVVVFARARRVRFNRFSLVVRARR